MSLTYQICEVTVTLPSLGTITTDGLGNQIKHGDKCRVDLYAVKPDWRSGSSFEGFIVGWLTYQGYCETPCKRSQKIMMPAGYKLVALMVDEYGMPMSWDSLPVQFSGGPICTPIDALIGNGITSESGRIYASGMGVSVDNGKEQVEFEAEKLEIAASSKGPLDSALQEAIKKIVNEAMQKATQPGGLLYGKR